MSIGPSALGQIGDVHLFGMNGGTCTNQSRHHVNSKAQMKVTVLYGLVLGLLGAYMLSIRLG